MIPSFHERNNARSARSATRFAADEAINIRRENNHELSSIDDRIDRLVLLCEAMWELISENTDLTEEDLHQRFVEVDERDGRRNFRRQREAHDCECGAKVPPSRTSCQFCGAPTRPGSLFDLI